MEFTFEDKYGTHVHCSEGSPYDASKSVSCPSCIKMLTERLDAWQDRLSEKYNLPDDFWRGYLRSWEK